MKKLFLTLFILGTVVFSGSVHAQDDLYTTIKKLPKDARFQYFYEVYKGDDGKYTTSEGSNSKFWFQLVKAGDSEVLTQGINVMQDKGEGNSERDANKSMRGTHYATSIGYPETSVIRHNYKKNGYVMIDNYLIKLSGISKDGLSYSSIDAVYIPLFGHEEKKEEQSAETKGKKKKKGGLKAKLAKLKQRSNYYPSHAAFLERDIDKMVQDYLKAMKAKQDAMTPDQLAEAVQLKAFIDADDAAAIKARFVTLKNGMSKDIFLYADDKTKAVRLAPGASMRFLPEYTYYYDFDGKRFYYPNQVKLALAASSKNGGKTIVIE